MKLRGLKSDKLTVIEDLGTRQERNGHWVRWVKCHCECGTEKITRLNNIKDKTVTSCGCKHKAMPEDSRRKGHVVATNKYRALHPEMYNGFAKKYHLQSNTRYATLKSVAKRRKIPMSITYEQYIILISNSCYYCENSLQGETGMGLDRIDNNKSVGYILSNVLPCCGSCNKIRGNNLTVAEMKFITKQLKIYRNQQEKNNQQCDFLWTI